ncbi:hypothetical protein J2752_000439 [Halarchaeum rubridurum]|uniref:Uncharacterized protein n=1 Tax=Halarchaeum rubridurum TaxID=489911 RepID=A0A8T4GJU5_9EURY|nr:hypothetical protein [Halarchaeum rubridurum]
MSDDSPFTNTTPSQCYFGGRLPRALDVAENPEEADG